MDVKRFDGNGRMSKAVIAGDMIYFCGQTSRDGGNLAEQTRVVLKKIDDLLETYGSDRKHLVTVQVYLKDISQFNEFNAIYDEWIINGYEPTRACVEAKMAAEQILVEIVVSAAKK